MKDITNIFTKAFTIRGRASRLEFNCAFLVVFIWLLICFCMLALSGHSEGSPRPLWFYLLVIIPEIFFITAMAAAMVRRIHDLNIDWKKSLAGRQFLGWKCHLEEGDPFPNEHGPPA